MLRGIVHLNRNGFQHYDMKGKVITESIAGIQAQ